MDKTRLAALKAAREAAKKQTGDKGWKQMSGADKDALLKAACKMLGLYGGN